MATSIQQRQSGDELPIEIEITLSGDEISVSSDPFLVHKHSDQVVRWTCKEPFLVEFDNDCPFYERQFSKDHPCSGLVRRNVPPDPKRIYKYTVRVGEKVLDPGGGVDK